MIITEAMNFWDVVLTTTGSIDNIYEYLIQYDIQTLQEDLTNKEIDVVFAENTYAQTNKLTNYKISTKDLKSFEELTTGAFSDGFSNGFDI